MNQSLHEWIGGFRTGDPQISGEAVVYPLMHDHLPGWSFLTAAEAFESGCLKIKEVNRGGSVPHLLAESRCPKEILLLEGQELVGAKQNRTLNMHILLPARGETVIPVSCTEQGRWSYRTPDFDYTDKLISQRVRKRINKDVYHNVKRRQGFRSDQRKVWEDIHDYQESFERLNATQSYDRLFRDLNSEIRKIEKQFMPVKEQMGMAVFTNGELQGVEWVASADVFARYFKSVLRSYVIDILHQRRQNAKRRNPFGLHPDYARHDGQMREIIRDFLAHVLQAGETVSRAPGLGYDHRLEDKSVGGNTLMYLEKPVAGHWYPADDKGGNEIHFPDEFLFNL